MAHAFRSAARVRSPGTPPAVERIALAEITRWRARSTRQSEQQGLSRAAWVLESIGGALCAIAALAVDSRFSRPHRSRLVMTESPSLQERGCGVPMADPESRSRL